MSMQHRIYIFQRLCCPAFMWAIPFRCPLSHELYLCVVQITFGLVVFAVQILFGLVVCVIRLSFGARRLCSPAVFWVRCLCCSGCICHIRLRCQISIWAIILRCPASIWVWRLCCSTSFGFQIQFLINILCLSLLLIMLLWHYHIVQKLFILIEISTNKIIVMP
jgi:hypothetical protein